MRDRDDDAAPDPWAPGGSMSNDWSSVASTSGTHASPTASPDVRAAAAATRNGRSVLLPIGGALALIAAIVAVFALREPNEPTASEPVLPENPVATSASDTIPTTTTADAATEAAADAIGEMTLLGETATGVDSVAGSDAAPTSDLSGSIRPSNASIIEVPDALADLAPFEVVAVSPSEGLVEVSLPSGRVRTTPLDSLSRRSRLTVNDFGAVLWPPASPGAAYDWFGADASRARQAGLDVRWVTSNPARNEFLVWSETADTAAPLSATSVESAGGVPIGSDAAWATLEGMPLLYVDPTGGLLFPDTGGWYRLDEAGVQRISTGDVLATGRNHVLLRECDQQRVCSLAALNANGARTLFSTDLPDDASPLSIDGLSPTGDALLMVSARVATDTPAEVQIFNLIDGTRATVYSSPEDTPAATWVPDGAGVIITDPQLMYHDRSTGTTTLLSSDLPVNLSEIGTRVPRFDPVCELVVVMGAIFNDMQRVGDTSIAPPRVEMLNRFAELASSDLATATAPLVTFVDSFVTPEQPETQRLENWPADVQAGVGALIVHRDTQCRQV